MDIMENYFFLYDTTILRQKKKIKVNKITFEELINILQ